MNWDLIDAIRETQDAIVATQGAIRLATAHARNHQHGVARTLYALTDQQEALDLLQGAHHYLTAEANS